MPRTCSILNADAVRPHCTRVISASGEWEFNPHSTFSWPLPMHTPYRSRGRRFHASSWAKRCGYATPGCRAAQMHLIDPLASSVVESPLSVVPFIRPPRANRAPRTPVQARTRRSALRQAIEVWGPMSAPRPDLVKRRSIMCPESGPTSAHYRSWTHSHRHRSSPHRNPLPDIPLTILQA